MQFIVTGHDGTDKAAPPRRMAARAAHLKLGDELRTRGELLYAAALLNDSGEMNGSCCIVEFPTRVELDAWLLVEPYMTGNVWQKVEIRVCKVGPSFIK